MDRNIWNAGLTTLAGFILGCAFGAATLAVVWGGSSEIKASDWLGFAGSAVGAIVAVVAAGAAWLIAQKQIAAGQWSSAIAILAEERRRTRDELTDTSDLAIFSGRLMSVMKISDNDPEQMFILICENLDCDPNTLYTPRVQAAVRRRYRYLNQQVYLTARILFIMIAEKRNDDTDKKFSEDDIKFMAIAFDSIKYRNRRIYEIDYKLNCRIDDLIDRYV